MINLRGRQVLAIGVAILVLGAVALTLPFRLLQAHAQNINPCGTLWTDSSADATDPTMAQDAQLDIINGNMSDNGSSLTTSLGIKSLSTTVATGTTENQYYMVWGFNGTSYYTEVDNSTINGITYSYGTYSSTTGFSGVGSATGTFTTGTPGTITVNVPFTAIGKPAAGDAFSAGGIFGESGYLTGATVMGSGGGVVTTSDKDTSSYDYEVGQSCGGATPTPSTPTATTTATSSGSTCTPGSPEQNISENGFICPVELPSSSGLGEPTIIHDSGAGNGASNAPRLFVQAPESIGNGTSGGSPLYTSLDGGLTWSAPVKSQFCTVASGGDTDLATDGGDNVYSTDLWLGNSCVSVSEDHGKTFAAGSPYGDQVQPGDDRPWIAWDKSINENFFTYDGVNAVHIANTAPISNPALGIQAVNDNVVVPESVLNSSSLPDSTRACVCPPGGIATDNSSGGANSHPGRVFVSYSHQKGLAVAYADPIAGTTPTWTQTLISDGTSGSGFQDEFNFAPVKVDGNGTVYVMWAHAIGFTSGNLAGAGGVQMYYSFSKDGGATWHAPILLSTEDGGDGSLGTTTFPTMDVAGNGTLDTAWYGTSAPGDPNSVPATATWNIYYARVTAADTNAPAIAPEVAVQDMHNGCIQTGGGKSCADRSLLDFFQVTDDPGSPNIIYTDGDVGSGVNIWFTKLASTPPNPSTPEAPWAALLLVPVLGTLGVGAVRRRRGFAQDFE